MWLRVMSRLALSVTDVCIRLLVVSLGKAQHQDVHCSSNKCKKKQIDCWHSGLTALYSEWFTQLICYPFCCFLLSSYQPHCSRADLNWGINFSPTIGAPFQDSEPINIKLHHICHSSPIRLFHLGLRKSREKGIILNLLAYSEGW